MCGASFFFFEKEGNFERCKWYVKCLKGALFHSSSVMSLLLTLAHSCSHLHIHQFSLSLADKYTQVARILSPIVQTVRYIDHLDRSPRLLNYVNTAFGGPERLTRDILLLSIILPL